MKLFCLILALLPSIIFAQSDSALQESMMKMMRQAQQTQQFMQGVDKSKLDGIEQEGRAMNTEVTSLCASGKRDKAPQKALAYSKEIMSRLEIQKIRKCAELMSVMPKIPFDHLEQNAQNKHICDGI